LARQRVWRSVEARALAVWRGVGPAALAWRALAAAAGRPEGGAPTEPGAPAAAWGLAERERGQAAGSTAQVAAGKVPALRARPGIFEYVRGATSGSLPPSSFVLANRAECYVESLTNQTACG